MCQTNQSDKKIKCRPENTKKNGAKLKGQMSRVIKIKNYVQLFKSKKSNIKRNF